MARRGQVARAVALGVAAGLALSTALIMYLSWTQSGRDLVRRLVLDVLGDAIHGEVSIGRIEGDLLRRFRLVDVSIRDTEGRQFVRADTIVTRVSLPALIRRRIRLSDVRIVHALVVLDKPPREEWNFSRVFGLRRDSTSNTRSRWGRWVSLSGVDLVDSRLMIKTAWDAADDLSAAEREKALAKALSPDSRENIVPVPGGGYQNVMDFRQLSATLPGIVLAHPDSSALTARVDHLSGILEPYRPPAADMRDLSGDFRLARDSLFMGDVHAQLPGSSFTGEGVYALESGELVLRMVGEPAAFADLRWLLPTLPEEGGGPVKLEVHKEALATRVVATDADMRVGESHVTGHFDVTLGDTVKLADTDLRFEQVDTRLVSRVLPALEPPRHGRATGHMVLAGTTYALDVDGDLIFTEPETGTSHILASGTVGVNGAVQLTNLRLRFDPLQAALAKTAMPELPTRGTIVGTATLTGRWKGLLHVNSDLTFRDPRAAPSRVRAVGRVDAGDRNRLLDMRVTFAPLYLDVLREEMPDLPRASTLNGTVVLNGIPGGVIDVDGDVALREPQSGESRFGLRGGIETGPLELHALDVRFHPLQPALVPVLGGPKLPFGGLLEGSAVLTGSLKTRIAFDADLVHTEAGDVSHVLGKGQYFASGTRRVSMDLTLQPIALATLGRAAPAAGLIGSARGNVHVEGALDALSVRGRLELADGSEITGGGTMNVAGDVFAYDLDLTVRRLDLSAVTTRVRQTTDLSGTVTLAGRGTDLATTRALVEADLTGSRVGSVPADELHLRTDLEDGLASFRPSWIRLATAEARVQGTFGLVEGREGVLTYQVSVDSLHSLAPWIPGADTAVVVPPRPAARAQAREEARVQLARALRSAEVERMATGVAPPPPPSQDTLPPPSLPVDSLAGSLRSTGELRGNIERFDAQGSATVQNLVYRGSAVDGGDVDYQILGVRAPAPDVTVDASLQSVLFRGLAYDSATVKGTYAGGRLGTGRADVVAWQDSDTELEGSAAFTFAEANKELRLEQLQLRVDSVTWTNMGVGVISWADQGTEIHGVELTSNIGGHVRVEGRVPKEGPVDLAVLFEDVEIAHVATILQEDLGASGRLWFDGRLRGTRENPRFEGDARWAGATLRGSPLPNARGRISYAHSQLSTDLELLSDERRLATVQARLPINLALTGVTGSRLLDAPLSVEVTADSLPLQGIAGLSAGGLANVQGALRGTFRVTGTFDDPVLEGGGDIVGGSLELPSLGIPLTDIGGRMSLQGNVIKIDSMVGYSRGPITVSGKIDVASLRDPYFDLVVEASNARLLNNDEGQLDVDANLTIRGPFDDVHVEGNVLTRRGVIYIPQLSELGATDMVALDDPVVFERVDTLLAARRDLLLARHSFLRDVHLDVGLEIDRDVWLRSIETNVEIYTPRELGPMRVRVDGDRKAVLLEGTINTDRGEYEFMTRRFNLTRGAVTFLGTEDLDAILQVAAEHEVRLPGIQPFAIRALISGTLRAPAITLESTSQPPISQTDLLTYVAFGRQATTLLPVQSSALSGRGAASGDLAGNVAALATQQLATTAVGTLVNDLEGEAARSLGVDVFRITPADLPEELFDGSIQDILQGTEIEVGSYVQPRFFLSARTRATQSTVGINANYVTLRGWRWTAAWEPRFLPQEPTLGEPDPLSVNVLGMYIFREWRKR